MERKLLDQSYAKGTKEPTEDANLVDLALIGSPFTVAVACPNPAIIFRSSVTGLQQSHHCQEDSRAGTLAVVERGSGGLDRPT